MMAKKRIIATILAVCLLFSGIILQNPISPVATVKAASIDISADPQAVVIEGPNRNVMTWDAFLSVASSSTSGTYTLIEDITIPFSLAYTPSLLAGKTFNGDNHIITLVSAGSEDAFESPTSTYKYIGLFQKMSNATVQNLRIVLDDDIVLSAGIATNNNNERIEAGIIAGTMEYSTIERVEVTGNGSLTLNAEYVAYAATNEETGPYPDVAVSYRNTYSYYDSYILSEFVALGGILGHGYGTGSNNKINECHFDLDLNLNGKVVPGRSPEGKMTAIANAPFVARFSLGGIVGIVSNSTAGSGTNCTITNCYAGGNLNSDVKIGRFFLMNSELQVFNFAAGILGSQTGRGSRDYNVSGTTYIRYCVANMNGISSSIKSDNSQTDHTNWIRQTGLKENPVERSRWPNTGFFAYSAGITNIYHSMSSGVLSGNYVTTSCLNNLKSDARESRDDGIYWNDMDSASGSLDGFLGEWYSAEQDAFGLTHRENDRYARSFVGLNSYTAVSRANPYDYGFNGLHYDYYSQRYTITEHTENTASMAFESLTVNSLTDVWRDKSLGGVYLAWRTWNRDYAIDIEVNPVVGGESFDREITMYLVDRTDPLNEIKDEVSARGKIAYEITYTASDTPASVDTATWSVAPLSPVSTSVLGYSEISGPGHKVTYEVTLPLMSSTVVVTRNDFTVSMSGGSVTWDFDRIGDQVTITAYTNYAAGATPPTLSIQIADTLLSALGYTDVTGAAATVFVPSNEVDAKAGGIGDNIDNFVCSNLATHAVTLPNAPDGVTYYYQIAAVEPGYSSTEWTQVEQADKRILSKKLTGNVKLYMYAEAAYSGFSPSRSNITGFSPGTGAAAPGDRNAAVSGTENTTASATYNGAFRLTSLLNSVAVNTDKVITIKASLIDAPEIEKTVEVMLGRILPKPVFSPNAAGEVFADSTRVHIQCAGINPGVYTILYRESFLAADRSQNAVWNITWDDLINTTGGGAWNDPQTTLPDGVKVYNSNEGIAFPSNSTYLTIWAVAVPTNPANVTNYRMSEVSKISYTSLNKVTPAAPTLYVHTDNGAGEAFNPSTYYDGTRVKFSFAHPYLTAAGGDARIEVTVNGKTLPHYYSDSEPIDLYQYALSDNPTIQVEARLNRTGYQRSYPREAIINFKRALNETDYELLGPYGQTIPANQVYESGTTIAFELNAADIPEAYRDSGAGVVVSSDTAYDRALPRIIYSVVYDEDTSVPPPDLTLANGTLYTPASPKLVSSSNVLIREEREAQKITLNTVGHGTKITVRIRALPAEDSSDQNAATSDRFNESTVKEINLIVRSQLETASVYPENKIAPNTPVELISNNAGRTTQIYYTMESGVPPTMLWDAAAGTYVPDVANGTLRYRTGDIISPASGTFNVQAMVVSETGHFAPSSAKTFRFEVNSLPQAQEVEAFPLTSANEPATLAIGATITLRSETIGTDIFYTLNNSAPVPGQPGTYLYDSRVGIMMQPQSGERQFIITAIARDQMGTTYADSKVAQFIYEIEKTAAPVATPATPGTDGSITVLEPGTIITLTSATANSKIYYTTDNTTPNPGQPNTHLYTTGGIRMPDDGRAFFTIWAMAQVEGENVTTVASDNVRFTYQPPAQVHAVYALPSQGEVVKGTEVQLFSSTEGAAIFYEIAHDEDDLGHPVAYSSQPYDSKSPIIINRDTWISAIAAKDGMVSVITDYEFEVSSQVRTPSPNIPGGSVVAKGTKLELSTTSGATIIYTKDGSDPSEADNKNRMYGSSIILDAEEGKSVSVSAYAIKDGMSDSNVVSFSYTISKQSDIFTINPAPGSVVEIGSQITLATSLSGATIHYTLDGSDPSSRSPTAGSITVEGSPGGTFLIKAIVVSGGNATPPQMFSYTIISKTPSPSSSIPTGAHVMDGAKAVLSVSEGNIYYTTDGNDPTVSSQLYVDPVVVDRSMVLKAIAIADGKAPSDIAEFIYTRAGQVAAPFASVQSGQLEPGTQVMLSTTTEGATIYYSTNGVDPDPNKAAELFVYDGPITISRPVTIKMIATKNLMHASVVNTVNYTVVKRAPAEEEEEDDGTGFSYDPNRLINRHDFSNQPMGPKYEEGGVILRHAMYGSVLSGPPDSLPTGAELNIQEISPTASEERAIKNELEFGILNLYDVTLTVNGEPVQPSQPVEIGLKIPDEYGNAVVVICYIDDSGTVTAYPTRRALGMAYAEVSHFSKYAIAAASLDTTGSGWNIPIAIVIAVGSALVAAILAIALLLRKRRRQ